MEKLIKTNIPRLDDALGGGLKQSSMTLFWAQPGIENAPFAYQLVSDRLDEGDSVIYLVQTKRADTIEDEMKHYGWGVESYKKQGNFFFIDAYSGLIRAPSKEKYFVKFMAQNIEQL